MRECALPTASTTHVAELARAPASVVRCLPPSRPCSGRGEDGPELGFTCVYVEAGHTAGKAAFLQGLHAARAGIAWTFRFPLSFWWMRKIKYSQSADGPALLAVRVSADAQRRRNKTRVKSTPCPEIYSNRAIYGEGPSGPLWKDAFVKYKVLFLRVVAGKVRLPDVSRAQCFYLQGLGATWVALLRTRRRASLNLERNHLQSSGRSPGVCRDCDVMHTQKNNDTRGYSRKEEGCVRGGALSLRRGRDGGSRDQKHTGSMPFLGTWLGSVLLA